MRKSALLNPHCNEFALAPVAWVIFGGTTDEVDIAGVISADSRKSHRDGDSGRAARPMRWFDREWQEQQR